MTEERNFSKEKIDEDITKKSKSSSHGTKQESPKKKIRNSGNNEFSLENARKIGNYLISDTIGQGTFGKVKIGIHINTKEKVAIKILEKAKITQKSDINRVTREIQILKKVRHPNIGQLYEIIESPRHLFLILEYINGGELFQYIVKRGRLTEEESKIIFLNLISGIDYLHEVGIVHRDIKPENILIEDNLRVKLVDFGLSNMYEPPSQLLKTACGSPCYAAPEMIQGKWYKPKMCDIWSSGIVLYAMTCGVLPFDDKHTNVLYNKIISGIYKVPPHLSPELKSLLSCILQVNPETRSTIEQIRDHFWFKKLPGIYKTPVGVVVGKDSIPIEMSVVRNEMSQMGFTDLNKIIQALLGNRHCQISTSYYLILKKKLRNGQHLKGDINSQNFDPNLLSPEFAPKLESNLSLGETQQSKAENLSEIDSEDKVIKDSKKNEKYLDSSPKTGQKQSQIINSNTSTTSGGVARASGATFNGLDVKGSSNEEVNKSLDVRRSVKRPSPLSKIFEMENEYHPKRKLEAEERNESGLKEKTDQSSVRSSWNGQNSKKSEALNENRPKITTEEKEKVFDFIDRIDSKNNQNEKLKTMLQSQTPSVFRSTIRKENPKRAETRRDASLGYPGTENILVQNQSERRSSVRGPQATPPESANNSRVLNDSTISKRVHNITNTSIVSSNTTGVNSSFQSRSASPAKTPGQKPRISIKNPEEISTGLKVTEILKTTSPQTSTITYPSSNTNARVSFNPQKQRYTSLNAKNLHSPTDKKFPGGRQDVLKNFIQSRIAQNPGSGMPRLNQTEIQGIKQMPASSINGRYGANNLTMDSVKREMIRKMGLGNAFEFGDASFNISKTTKNEQGPKRKPGIQTRDKSNDAFGPSNPVSSTQTPSVLYATATNTFQNKPKPFKITRRPSTDNQDAIGLVSGTNSVVYSKTSGKNTPTKKGVFSHF